MTAQCVRCHDAGGRGNQAGPVLTGIGKRVDKNTCRSLITPNSEIATGFGVTIVELTNDKSLVGRVENKLTNHSRWFRHRVKRSRFPGEIKNYQDKNFGDATDGINPDKTPTPRPDRLLESL